MVCKMMNNLDLERCNRCCSNKSKLISDSMVSCEECGFTEPYEIWQLFGWRSLIKYPPTYGGVIYVYGKNIGRSIARWDKDLKQCDNVEATHWLRTPDPTKQINM